MASKKTIGQLVRLYLEGDPGGGWAGKLRMHPRDKNGHSEGMNHHYALKHLVEVLVQVDDDHPAADRRSLFGGHLKVGELFAAELKPTLIRLYQEHCIAQGNKRKVINRNVCRLLGSNNRRGESFFEWLVQIGEITPDQLVAFRCVSNIRPGRPDVEESERICAAPTEDFEAALHCCDKQLEEMMRVQYLCSMRPGELLVMRPCDLRWDEKEDQYAYYPKKHKNLWRGQTRRVWVGPIAWDLISDNSQRLWGSPTLFNGTDLPRPGDAADQRFFWADQDDPSRPRFALVQSYTKAIRRACERAKVPLFTAQQIRKRSATDAYEREGEEVATQVAGHAKGSKVTRKHYIDPQVLRDDVAAADYAKRFG